jgi:hypothetical protein
MIRRWTTVLLVVLSLLPALVCRAESPFVFRGTATTLPFWLGTNLYGDSWTGFGQVEHSTNWWWYDKAHWEKTFKQYEDAHLNTMVFWHPHPYVGFIRMNRFPEAAYFSPEETERQIEMFRWITAEGRKHGVNIYLETWNICLPPGFCKAHGVDEFAADTPLVREYTRYVVGELFRTYPDLAGLVTMAAEAPPGCNDFVRNAILPGLQDSVLNGSPRKTLPKLIFWTWCSYPEDAKKTLDAYPGEKYVMHYLQYEQYFKPMADPRILMTSKAMGGMKVLTMGGPSTATGWLFWGDPFFVQKTMEDLVRKNGAGILFSGTDAFDFIAERWVAREAFERYSLNPNQHDRPEYWEGRIADRYGDPKISKPLLRAMVDSSDIMPRFMCLVHSQTDHFQPQCGLPLVNYLEMPTISTYVFENHDSIDKKGRLVPCMGLTWPNPDWGEKVISIKDYVAGLTKPGARQTATTPSHIADEIERMSHSSLDAIGEIEPHLDAVKVRRQELVNTLRLIRINAYLGLHQAEMIRAGIAWESWRVGLSGSSSDDVLAHLDKSIEYWRMMDTATKGLWPQPMEWVQSQVPSEPPWSHWDLWNNYTKVTISNSDMTRIYLRERSLIAEQLRGDRKVARLPLFPELDVPVGEQEPIASYNFEGTWPADLINDALPGVTVAPTNKPGEVISGKHSLLCDTRGSNEEWHMLLQTDPTKLHLKPGERYVVEFEYRIIDPGTRLDGTDPRFDNPTPFAVAARTNTGGVPKDIGTHRTWGGRAGQTGHKVVIIEPKDYDDYFLFFSTHWKASVVLDNIKISRLLPAKATAGGNH